jgi:hypothetical protein
MKDNYTMSQEQRGMFLIGFVVIFMITYVSYKVITMNDRPVLSAPELSSYSAVDEADEADIADVQVMSFVDQETACH